MSSISVIARSFLSIDDVEIDFDSLWQPQLEDIENIRESSTQWLRALQEKQAFLSEHVLEAINKKQDLF